MVRLEVPNPPASEAALEALRKAGPSDWPSDHLAFLAKHDGGSTHHDAFAYASGRADTLARIYGASEVLQRKSELVGRLGRNVWPIASTTTGNQVVLSWSDDWKVGFWDHETEGVTEFVRSFSAFSAAVSPYEGPALDPENVVSVWKAPGFDERFAKYRKK
jgi:hypothetical protein